MSRPMAVGIMIAFCIVGVASMATAGLLGDIRSRLPIPDPEQKAKEEARKKLRLQIPDLDRILKEEPGLTTSFEDAVTGIAFLDDYEPFYTAPLCQLPMMPDGGFLISVPGDFEYEAASYCLRAGTYGPGGGEGYLYAQLKGSQAGLINDLLSNSMQHLDISQQHVQALVWAVQSKTKVNDMSDELQVAARRLLTRDQINRLNGGALGMVPNELFEQAFFDVPAPLRMVMEAEARLRSSLTSGIFNYGELSRIAVLSGDPPDDGEGPMIPRGRWSFDPEGFFVRYFPNGYHHTTIQLLRPGSFNIVTDQLGRIVSIANSFGSRIDIEYDEAVDPLAFDRDDRTKGYALKLVRLTRVAPGSPAEQLVAQLPDVGWTAVGLPTDRGRPTNAGNRYAGADERYRWAQAHHKEIIEVAGHFRGAADREGVISGLVSLGHLSQALVAAVGDDAADVPWIAQQLAMVKQAWGAQLSGLLAPETAPRVAWRTIESHDGQRLASLGLKWVPIAHWQAAAGAGGYGGYRPSSGAAMPGQRGRQRLGLSSRPYPSGRPGSRELKTFDPRERNPDNSPSGGSGKEAYNNSKKAIDWINRGKTAIDLVTDPLSGVMGLIGADIPGSLFGKIIDFNFDAWGKASQALGGDPPRDDFTLIAERQPVIYPMLEPDVKAAIPAARAAALEALMAAFAEQMSTFSAAQITLDRLGGAMLAGDEQWTYTQSVLLIDYKHRAGAEMIVIADAIDAYIQSLEADGITDIYVSADNLRTYQARLAAEGFNATELQAAQIVGLDQAEIDQMLQERTSFDPEEEAGDAIESLRTASNAIRDLGMSWRTLPPAP